MKTLGILDTQDNLWIGNDSGPFSFTEEEAKFAQELLCERLGLPTERLAIRPLQQTDKKRDEVTCEKTLEEAIDIIQLRRMSIATGISVEKLKRIERGGQLQSHAEDRLIRQYLGVP